MKAFLFKIAVDGGVEIRKGLFIPLLRRFHDTMVQVIFQDQYAGVVQRGTHGGKLGQDFRTVPFLQNHLPYGLQMADGPGKTVENGPGLFGIMGMAVAVMGAGVKMGMIVVHGCLLFKV